MNTAEFLKAILLLFVLLNPFTMTVYLLSMIEQLDRRTFAQVLARGATISFVVFVFFCVFGVAIFSDLLQVRFAAFLIFGGLVFLNVGFRLVFKGSEAVEMLRGTPEQMAGSVAMPFMIGPGTVSASILAGAQLGWMFAPLAIAIALIAAVSGIVLIKAIIDYVRKRYESLVARYIDIIGRISALVVGTIAVDMLFRGVEMWLIQLGVLHPGQGVTQHLPPITLMRGGGGP